MNTIGLEAGICIVKSTLSSLAEYRLIRKNHHRHAYPRSHNCQQKEDSTRISQVTESTCSVGLLEVRAGRKSLRVTLRAVCYVPSLAVMAVMALGSDHQNSREVSDCTSNTWPVEFSCKRWIDY